MAQIKPIASERQQFQDNDLVCYCFSYTKKAIEEDFSAHGYSTILEKIKTEKKNNGCHCETRNPRAT
ncbi:hypothetical protein DPPLL_09000 [Desulfofustis limnaeus]|jgi:hypothetical protein|uniref:BFD-like (2Fe-2S) protein n=1 Tax=Desulfofustis limnaeus TaxID=2740163 RepID=A0ABM7W6I1_9BACT|nr:hypothetical protein DPPLL_09000 [Desulfofustis limnaeus]